MQTDNVSLVFPDNFDTQWQQEALSREYFSECKIRTTDGRVYKVFFISDLRLSQELSDTVQSLGQAWFSEPGLIVLRDFTFENMAEAVSNLWIDGYFSKLYPFTGVD